MQMGGQVLDYQYGNAGGFTISGNRMDQRN
jgi:hypothetical protein